MSDDAMFLLLVLLLAVFLSPTVVADEEPAGPLSIEVSPPEPKTYDLLTIMVRFAPGANNTTAAPGVVNVTLEDLSHNVTIASREAVFLNGTARLQIPVDPVWSDALVKATARDLESGLSASVTFRTELSQSYVLFTTRRYFDERLEGIFAHVEAARAFERGAELAAAAAFVSLFGVLFLRADHNRSRDFGIPSYVDRLLDRVWNFAIVPDDIPFWLDEGTTDDLPYARGFWRDRQDAAIRALRSVKDDIDAAIDAEIRRQPPPPPDDEPAPAKRGMEVRT